MATKKKSESDPANTVKARVLVTGAWGNVDDVVDVPAGTESPDLDTDPAAVAYAAGLPQNQRTE